MQQIAMHRSVMNASDEIQVDHWDGNGLDNRKSNLRLCTFQQNQQNKRISRNNKSGMRGVWYLEKYGKWRVHLQCKHLGYFNSFEEACEVRRHAELEAYGEFSGLLRP